jgi:hypothetical protein
MPLSQKIEPFCVEHISGWLPNEWVHTQLAMQAQVGVPWHSIGIGAQYSPPPPATPPTSNTQTVPLGQPVLGHMLLKVPPSPGAPPSA